MNYFGWIEEFQSWQDSIWKQCARNQTWITQRSSPYPNLVVDLLRWKRRGRNPLTAAETSDRRLLATRRRSGDHDVRGSCCAGEGFQRNFQNLTRGYLYPGLVRVTEWNDSVAPRCRITSGYCNSVWPNCSNGCTEIENLDQLSELGMTERNESVRPKYTERFWKFKSMTNRWLWVLLTQRVRIWLDQTLWCSMNRVWEEKSIDS